MPCGLKVIALIFTVRGQTEKAGVGFAKTAQIFLSQSRMITREKFNRAVRENMTQGAFQLDWHITHWVWLMLMDIKLRFDNFNMNSYRLELWLVFHAKGSVGQAMVSFFPRNHCWERKLFWPVALQVQIPTASFYYRNDCRSCWLVSVACKDHWRQGRKVTDHRRSNPKSTKWIKRLECSSQRCVGICNVAIF